MENIYKKDFSCDVVKRKILCGRSRSGGQLKAETGERKNMVESRIESLYKRDSEMALRKSHENPELKQLYAEFYGSPLSPLAEQMLHTSYIDRSRQ
jgi:iron only hydrogenase large subunit-like protein